MTRNNYINPSLVNLMVEGAARVAPDLIPAQRHWFRQLGLRIGARLWPSLQLLATPLMVVHLDI